MFVIACVFIALKGHSFYDLFIFSRTQWLAKLSSWLSYWGRGVSIACCHSHLCYMSCLLTGSDKRQAEQGLLSLLVCNKVFFPCWCAKWSSFPICTSQVFSPIWCFINFLLSNFAMATQTKWPLVIKHINWVDNHQMIITAKYGSHME